MKEEIKTTITNIETTDGLLLNGLLFGPTNPKNIYIYIHGLGGNLFSKNELLKSLVNKDTAVLAFNNRGSGLINFFKIINSQNLKERRSKIIGMAHEVFTDCVYDLEGAINKAKSLKAKNIYLIGHSTGCQKIIYYLYKKPNNKIKKIILLAPMCDFADTYKFTERKILNRALATAKKMVNQGSAHKLLPENIWPGPIDAQRFLSLNTIESAEEIFTYASGKKPSVLQKLNKPALIVFAGEDEYADRPMEEISAWFEKTLTGKDIKIKTVADSYHNFADYFKPLSKIINNWIE